MPPERLVLGTRGSPLARIQTGWVQAELLRLHPGLDVAIEVVETRGDTGNAPLWTVSGDGIFTRELEEALKAGRIGAAVHSLKDMPTALPEDLVVAAVPRRADPRDALVTRGGLALEKLPPGTAVGTSSLRRIAQVIAARSDLRPRSLRGNLDTRLGKVASGEIPAALLAAAALARLGQPEGLVAFPLPLDTFVPAAGQGALGIEARKRDRRDLARLEPLGDPAAEAATRAERALLSRLGVGCHVPLGAHARVDGGVMTLQTFLAYPDGHGVIRVAEQGLSGQPEALADQVAERLLAAGARAVLDFVNTAAEKALRKEHP
jgi:hydroxymethylbilane synthase